MDQLSRIGDPVDFHIDRAPASTNYLHLHYHPCLPQEVRLWVNGEKLRITIAEMVLLRDTLDTILAGVEGLP